MAARCRAKRGVFKRHRAPSHGAQPRPTRNILRTGCWTTSTIVRQVHGTAADGRSRNNFVKLRPALANGRPAIGQWLCILARSYRNHCRNDSIGYPRMSASGESSTTMHRLLHASGSHPIPSPNDPNIVGIERWLRVSPGRESVFVSRCEGERQYRTLISLLGSLATMHRVVNYHSSWVRQRQETQVLQSGRGFNPAGGAPGGNPGSTAGRGFNPAGGAPGGG
ncbi:hypothetical protein F511_09991 [Dorcoceras hygrometricum]|uniref:Uncharacterized protein n=1 Tax=Dorcoceras hygrometricum TaxID=472368 RepID=A0A2Z7AJ62_9LAMI|nr:hypothetical protein F511_09991 [Dorcoceras hygrometricum]